MNELEVDHVLAEPLLPGVELLGYSFPQEGMVFEQGDRVPVTILWRLTDGRDRTGVFRMWLEGAEAWQVLPIPVLPPLGDGAAYWIAVAEAMDGFPPDGESPGWHLFTVPGGLYQRS